MGAQGYGGGRVVAVEDRQEAPEAQRRIQARVYPPAQAYLARRQQAGRTAREVRRALKRHLVRRVWRRWQACWSDPPAALPVAA